jgi:hypothetical protein
LGLEQSGFASWNLLFSQMGPRWAGSGSEPWGPQPTPWPTAAPGGEKREGGALHRPYVQQGNRPGVQEIGRAHHDITSIRGIVF